MAKHVYFFGDKKAEGDSKMRNLLGGKGADLAEMTNLGISVPPGFTISTEVCTHFMENGGSYPDGLAEEVRTNLSKIEKVMGAVFGDPRNPLLVSVRSGARKSMPGMMDTVLNLGLNDATVEGLAAKTETRGSRTTATAGSSTCTRTWSSMSSTKHFQGLIDAKKEAARDKSDHELTVDHLKSLISEYKALVEKGNGRALSRRTREAALGGDRGGVPFVEREPCRGLPSDGRDTAPLGHRGQRPGDGVRKHGGQIGDRCRFHARSGDRREEVLRRVPSQRAGGGRGRGDPHPAARQHRPEERALEPEPRGDDARDLQGARIDLPKSSSGIFATCRTSSSRSRRAACGCCRPGRGNEPARSAIRIAVDMVAEGLIDEKTALKRVDPEQLETLLHPMIDPKVKAKPIAKGLPASPGAASGGIVFSVEEAVERVSAGEKVVLVRLETSPEDVEGMKAAEAIVTARGGMTSHAAVVARGMGKCCVVGCSALSVDSENRLLKVGGKTYRSGDAVTIDGSTGNVYEGVLPTVDPILDDDYYKFMTWADAHRRLKVRANADTPEDAEIAVKFGAEGIGLARTEHMFFKEDRIPVVREMILAATREERVAALKKILPMQRSDFVGVFRAMNGQTRHHPASRSAAPRVPPQGRGGDPQHRRGARPLRRRDPGRIRRSPRVQPDARTPGLPVGDHLSGDLRGPGRGDSRSGGDRQARGCGRETRDHGAPRRNQGGARSAARDDQARRRRRSRRGRRRRYLISSGR